MCGIVGCWDWHTETDAVPATLRAMLGRLRHRGPDEMGYYFDARGGMGAARLAILDPEHGQQPMADPTGRYWLSYNGEIYNHVELRDRLAGLGHAFETHCDTEVLLRACIAWGPAALEQLNGPFALAFYDRAAGDLLLGRDRYGKRPLYLTRRGGAVAFASEVKALTELPGFAARLDPEALATIYHTWTPLPGGSPFRGVTQLPPGTSLTRRGGEVRVARYAPLRFDRAPVELSEDEAAERVREALTDAVRLRLRSDVEVGAYLSGGLDSSITTALAVRLGSGNVRSFGVSFDDPAYDESAEQRRVSEHLGTRHETVSVTHRDIAGALPEAVAAAETPVFRTAFVPMHLLSGRVQQAGIKVVLTGEGADEVFLGYNIFKETLLRQRWSDAMSEQEKREAIAALYPYQPHFQAAAGRMVGLFDRLSKEKDDALFSHALRFHNASFAGRLLAEPRDGAAALRGMAEAADGWAAHTPLQRAQWLEFKTLLAGYLLSTQGDRMSMAHSVENRCPMLDPRVVELAASLPVEQRLCGGEEKRVLKRAFAGVLPPEVAQRAKQPYRAPDAAAVVGARPDYLDAVLSEAELAKVEVLDTGFAQRLAGKLLGGDPEKISPREDQAFLLLLSTALLHERFCRGGLGAARPVDDLLVREVDGRELADVA